MPLNSCSINAYTIDSLRCRRGGVVPPQPVTGKAHPYHTRIDPRPWQEHEPIDITKLEGPNIRITITIDGEVHAATYENNFMEMRPLVTVSGLTINSKDDLPTIKVNDFNIRTVN